VITNEYNTIKCVIDILLEHAPIIIGIVTIRYIIKGVKHWQIDKSMTIDEKLREKIYKITEDLEKIDKNNATIEDKRRDLTTLNIHLLNELNIIAFIINKKYIDNDIAKQTFNRYIKFYYEKEFLQTLIEKGREEDKNVCLQLEKLYKKWNKEAYKKMKEDK